MQIDIKSLPDTSCGGRLLNEHRQRLWSKQFVCTRTCKTLILRSRSLIPRWRGDATGRALDLKSIGRGFKSYSRQCRVTTVGKLFTPTVCASVTKQYNLVPTKERWRSAAEKVTAGLAESNGSLPPGGRMQRKWTCTRGKRNVGAYAPHPTTTPLNYGSESDVRRCALLVRIYDLFTQHFIFGVKN